MDCFEDISSTTLRVWLKYWTSRSSLNDTSRDRDEEVQRLTEELLRRGERLYTGNFAAYGLNNEEFESLLQRQEWSCGICHVSFETAACHIDHDHETGKVRGLLCQRCNIGLGHLGDSIEMVEAALIYLRLPTLLEELEKSIR